ncbi:MAG: recQ [Chloroflexi bacterium]|nr:recQ [Chloroflexota bacterium]
MTASIPKTDRAHAELRSVFGFTSFRPLQEPVVRAILAGRDVFVLMPTGGGKSLCYQLPAILLDGITLVVSPLIALMKDQVDALQAQGVAATFVNSSLDSLEVGRRQAAVARGEVKIVYVAPERLMTPGFLRLLSSAKIAFIAIDEAHCISEWGHDFRPDYRELARLRELFPATPVGAFTATATRRVQADIVEQLHLESADSFRGRFNRPNLFYKVLPKQSADHQLISCLERWRGASGIVYCQARAETERVADVLRRAGFGAAAYHAGLLSDDRKNRQEAFIRDDVRIIVATIAFGMGIDKPDVRFVVHYDLPRSLEGFYQESGRAGRDGDPSECVLLYSYGDVAKVEHFIAQRPEPERVVALAQIRRMADWADAPVCRRAALLSYFDEPLDDLQDPCCDVCSDPPALDDYTVAAQKFLSCVLRTGQRFGTAYVIDVLRGSKENERIPRFGHDRLSTFGIGKDVSTEEWQHIARGLLMGGFARRDEAAYNAVTITDRGNAVLFRGEAVHLVRPRRAAKARTVTPRVVAPEIESLPPERLAFFDALRALRKQLADQGGVPPYVIFHDRALREIASRLPKTRQELLRISGIGERKAQTYGDPFLECVYRRTAGSAGSRWDVCFPTESRGHARWCAR